MSSYPLMTGKLILDQHTECFKNREPSAISKAHGKGPSSSASFHIGDLVYLTTDCDKTKAREKYMTVECSSDHCKVRKFTQSQF